MAQKSGHMKTMNKRVTTIGRSKNSRPMKKLRNKKRGVKKYRGQGK